MRSELGLDVAKRSGYYGDDYKFTTFSVDKILKSDSNLTIGGMKIIASLPPGIARIRCAIC